MPPLTAQETPKKAYGKVRLTQRAALWDNLPEPVRVVAPKYMEDIGQNFGYVLYRAEIKGPCNDWPLNFAAIHDRAQIFVDGKHRQTYMRDEAIPDEGKVRVPLGWGQTARLDILVENMGRVNYGRELRDQKGATGICFGNQFHFGWDMYGLPMDDLSKLRFRPVEEKRMDGPVFLRGELEIEDEPCDTFLGLEGFTKGFVTVNGFNLGRFWAIGPTKTLYVPAPILRQGKNEIIVFESDAIRSLTVEFFAQPDLGRTTK